MNVFEITLDVDKRLNHETVVIRQDDRSGTTVSATLRDHGEPMGSGDYTARFCMLLPDRKTYYSDGATYSSGVVTAVIDEQYAAQVPGTTNNAYFELYDGEELKYTTASFAVIVKPSALGGKAAESYDSRIEELMAELREAIDACAPPTVTVVDGDGTHTVTIEFPETSGTFTVSDGVSPSVSITDTASGHVITFVDADGEHSYEVPTYVAEEAVRAAAEASRASAEQARVSAEQQRVTAESAREGAESARDADWASVRTAAVNATSSANAAATSASTAASGANEAVTDLRAAATRGDFDGYSPTVAITSTSSAHMVTVTDKRGAHSYTVPTYAEEEQARAYAWNELSDEVSQAVEDANEAAAAVRPETKRLLGNVLSQTLSGTILTADDAYAAPPISLSVDGVSTQAGTPTPDAPVPILSVDDLSLEAHGKNLLSTDLIEQGAIATDQTDKSSQNRCRVAASYNLDALAGNTVTCSGTVNGGALQYALSGYDGGVRVSSNWINSGSSYNIPAGRKKNRILFRRSDDANISPADFSNIQLELGSTATTYEPYQGTTVSDLLPEDTSLRSLPDGTKDTLSLSYLRPSTREGWAWYSRSMTRGVGHVADMGELTWALNSTNGYFTARIDDMNQTTSSRLEGLLCTAYGMSSTSGLTPTSPEDKKMMRYGGMIVIRDSSYSTAADFKAALNASLSYQLATPITTQLDPIELPELPAPTVTVWCDGGSAQPTMQMTYEEDVNMVIGELRAIIADVATG